VDKITSLTPEQMKSLEVTRQEWIARAVREHWEPEVAKACIPDVYKAANLNSPPADMIFCVSNPMEALRLIEFLNSSEKDRKKKSFPYKATYRIDAEGKQTLVSVALKKGVTHKATWVAPSDSAGWCGWRAFYDFFFKEFGLAAKLQPYIKLDKTGAYWWWFFEESCVICGPPKFSFDRGVDNNDPFRLHNATGPALDWGPAFGLYFWHGVGIPGDYLEAVSWSPDVLKDKWTKESNAERKRALVEIAGWSAVAEALGAKEVQRDDWGSLLEADLGDDTGKLARFVRVKDSSTDRMYTLRVPPETKTCLEGCAWTGFTKPEEYVNVDQS
jgi:hypothetical protein